jgi:hypothetical protein
MSVRVKVGTARAQDRNFFPGTRVLRLLDIPAIYRPRMEVSTGRGNRDKKALATGIAAKIRYI